MIKSEYATLKPKLVVQQNTYSNPKLVMRQQVFTHGKFDQREISHKDFLIETFGGGEGTAKGSSSQDSQQLNAGSFLDKLKKRTSTKSFGVFKK